MENENGEIVKIAVKSVANLMESLEKNSLNCVMN